MLSAEYEDNIMLDEFGEMSAEIFKHEIKNIGRKPKGRCYSTDIKKFALNLHYYSPKAYAFCRLDFCYSYCIYIYIVIMCVVDYLISNLPDK